MALVPLAYIRLTNSLMRWLVNVFVDAGAMLHAMNPVDADIVEGHIQHGRDQ